MKSCESVPNKNNELKLDPHGYATMQNLIVNISNILRNATHKHHIDSALNEYLNLIESQYILTFSDQTDQIVQLACLFRDKAYEFIFSKGDIASPLYLCLYMIVELEADSRFESFIKVVDTNLFAKGVSEEENIMLIELGSIARIFGRGRNEGLKFYIQNICLIDMYTPSASKVVSFILRIFKVLNVPFELFLSSIQELLSPKRLFLLEPKRRRSVFNWQIHTFWNIEHFFNHRDWLKLSPLWEEALYTLCVSTEASKIDEALYLQFFIYHMCGNSFVSQKEWREFNQKITQKVESVYELFAQIFHLSKPEFFSKPKKIIGFVRDRIVENSPYKVEYSFLKNLLQCLEFSNQYEVRVYTMGLLEKSDDDEQVIKSYESLGIQVVNVVEAFNQQGYYNSHLSKALAIRETMIRDGVDILISPNNGYGISDFLLATRTATKQIFWSHGNFVYDLPQIDVKITHICGNSAVICHEGYEFMGVGVEMDEKFYNPQVPKNIIEEEREKFPKNKLILGVIGRLTKIDSLAYLKSVINIMCQHHQSIFLACGNGNIYEIKQKIAFLLKEMQIKADFIERFYFPGYVNNAIYGHIIDFWLDSFPMEQGESRIEFCTKGGLALTLSKESKQDRQSRLNTWLETHFSSDTSMFEPYSSLESLRQIWLEDSCVAYDMQDYISKADTLLSLSQSQKQELSKKYLFIRKVYNGYRKKKGIRAFLNIIKDA